ncbi:hypothetical protein [Rubrivivax albus]|uniref:Uncharacterized protein n=1 Tax=Rubrivivax albus TaxID=2499835 RepID=A0A437JRW1_9BURK|nr:hypothetical protein [Rubrivivax albus]RVT49647.1 hypothetical protein ENE75_18550 [Rubrivivax albus]
MRRAPRKVAAERWAQIAAGDFSLENRQWLQQVARDLLKAEAIGYQNDKRMEICAAVGFAHRGEESVIPDIVEIVRNMPPDYYDEPSHRRELEVTVRKMRGDPPGLSIEAIRAQIKRARDHVKRWP